MKYIVWDQRKNGETFTEEFDDLEDAVDTAVADWRNKSKNEKNDVQDFYLLESENPDPDADNHFDGNDLITFAENGLQRDYFWMAETPYKKDSDDVYRYDRYADPTDPDIWVARDAEHAEMQMAEFARQNGAKISTEPDDGKMCAFDPEFENPATVILAVRLDEYDLFKVALAYSAENEGYGNRPEILCDMPEISWQDVEDKDIYEIMERWEREHD